MIIVASALPAEPGEGLHVRRMLISKLERLEAQLDALRSIRDPVAENIVCDLFCDQIREYLLSAGIEQTEQESLACACP